MKRVNKSIALPDLVAFVSDCKPVAWNDLRCYQSGILYESVRNRLFQDQNWLCAYCESKISDCKSNKHNQRVEHFHSKSDQSNVRYDITFDWNNLIGVCLGGTEYKVKGLFEMPENESCDVHKETIESKSVINSKNWHGVVLFPPNIPAEVYFFDFELSTGKIVPNVTVCNKAIIEPNKFKTTLQLVQNTIDVFNLNCRRLNEARREILYERERIINRAKSTNNINMLKFIFSKWLNDPSLMYTTTRRALLKESSIARKVLNL